MKTLLLATSNMGKAAEFQTLLALRLDMARLRLVTLRDRTDPLPEVEETGATFLENARIKALAYAQAFHLPSLADDSGLCVDALGGEPGIRSARWAGPTDADRNAALLRRLRDVPDALRSARFVCALCLALPGGGLVEAEGVCDGVIMETPRGRQGFGYDPLFFLPEVGLTFAELTAQLKNQRSHRARAAKDLSPKIARLLGTFDGNCR